MQAQNIAIVDRIVRHFERAALEEFYKDDRFSMDDLYPLSAMSQVWVFCSLRIPQNMASTREQGDRICGAIAGASNR